MLLRPRAWPSGLLGLLLLAGLQAPLAQAGQSSGVFSVSITLVGPPAIPGVVTPGAVTAGGATLVNGYGQSLCVSASFQVPTGATVRVVCGGGEFAAIAPETGAPDPRILGEVYRTRFGPGAGDRPAWIAGLRPALLAGTGASYQVQRLPDWDDPLQLVVSF